MDTIVIGDDPVGMQQITRDITVDNDPWYTDVLLYNFADDTPHTTTIDLVERYNVVTVFSPAVVRYDSSDTRTAVIYTGVGSAMVNLLRTRVSNAGTTILATQAILPNTQDIVNVGNAVDGLQSIVGTLEMNLWGNLTSLTLDDCADAVARSVSHSYLAGSPHDLFEFAGLSSSPIRYAAHDSSDRITTALLAGSASDSFAFQETPSYNTFKLDTGRAMTT